MARNVLWKVLNTTARDALVVAEPEVGNYALVYADGVLYKAIKGGTGSGVWESAVSLQDVVDDTTPSLGGPLDVNGSAIVSLANADILITPHGTGGLNTKGFVSMKAIVVLTDAATVATNAALGNMFRVTIGATRILGNPTNLVAGGTYTWEVIQGGVGSFALTYGNLFKFRGGAPTLTAAAGSVDVLTGYYNGTNLIMQPLLDVKA